MAEGKLQLASLRFDALVIRTTAPASSLVAFLLYE